MPAAALWVLVNGATASGQQKETAPSKPVAISTEIEYGWSLSIVADARGITSRVGYDAQSGVLERTRAHISVKDCERLADAIETAAKAVKGDKRFENDGVGDVTISTGLGDVYLPGRDGKEGKTEKRQCVLLGGGESGLFMKSLNMNLDPEKAAAFATAIRGVPAVYARLKSSIDFDAMFKGK